VRAAAVIGLALLSLLSATAGLGARAATARAPAERQAGRIAVVGAYADIQGGFNLALACCNGEQNAYFEAGVLRGAFVQNSRSVWVKDLVSSAAATTRGVTYTIRKDAFWYWGGRRIPVTYRDFVYTLRQIDDPQSDVADREGYANLDPTRFTHDGDRRVTFFWRTTNCSTDFPCGPFADWQALFSQLYPSFALHDLDFNKLWTSCICGSDGKPVSDGPFYLTRYTPGQAVVLKANPYFYEKARLAEVDFEIIGSDPAVQTEAISDGQVDLIDPSFTPDVLPLRSVAGLAYQVAPSYALEQLEIREGSARGGPSVTKGGSNVLLRAPWMRQAIMLALDRQSMIDQVYGPGTGLKPVDDLLYFPGEAGYRPDLGRWNHDPAKAIAILRKHCTGGPTAPAPQTTRVWRCDGLPASFQYTWPSIPARTIIEQVAKADLKAVGIAIVDRPVPGSVLFGPDGPFGGGFDLTEFADFTSGDPGDWFDQYRCFGDQNITGYCSHIVDTLLRDANGELDPTKRRALVERADAGMATEVPVIPLFQKPGVVVHKSSLLGVVPNPGTDGPFWNIQDWHWKR